MLAWLASGLPAQGGEPLEARGSTSRGDGEGRAPTYRLALAEALHDAVDQALGQAVARDPALLSRISVVMAHEDGDQPGWFDGVGEEETDWVKSQLAGFLRDYKILKRARVDGGMWEAEVEVSAHDAASLDPELVIEIVESEPARWRHDRYEQGGDGEPFERRSGRFEAHQVGAHLIKNGVVRIVGKGVDMAGRVGGVGGQRAGDSGMAPSHRVAIDWKSVVVDSTVEAVSDGLPARGPRYEWMSGGSIKGSFRIEDLVVGKVLVPDTAFSVEANDIKGHSVKEFAKFVGKLRECAKVTAAAKVYFSLRKPVVLRKWRGADGEGLIEARIAKGFAADFDMFSLGIDGAVDGGRWSAVAHAELVEGSSTTCVFKLIGDARESVIEVGGSEVRPVIR